MYQWLKSGSLKRPTCEIEADNSVNDVNEVQCTDQHSTSSSDSNRRNVNSKSTVGTKVRKYNTEYLQLGFTFAGTEDEPKPQCVICLEILSNESIKPSKLRRHFETKHGEFTSKSLDFFVAKLGEFKKSQKVMKSSTSLSGNKKATLASYEVAQLVAKSGKAHTIAEELILPAAIVLCKTMLGESAAKLISSVPLSNNSIQRRITDMSANIEETLFTRLSTSDKFALQLDESTDIASKSSMLVFVRFIWEKQLFEDFLFSCELLHTSAKDIFEAIDKFFTEHGIRWEKCVGITTDGAAAMSGYKTGLLGRVKEVAPQVKWTHCCIHREALVAKRLSEHMKTTLEEVVKIINFIKSRPLQSRLFEVLCKDMGSDHVQLILHTEIRWLSRGKILQRFFELRDEVRVFLLETRFVGLLTDFSWLSRIAYFADVFEYLNTLNLSLQGIYIDVFHVEDKIEATIKKFEIWAIRVEKNSFSNFPTLQSFLESSCECLSQEVKSEISEHLLSKAKILRKYFHQPDPNNTWIRNPFSCDIEKIENLSEQEQDELIDLVTNATG
ncbi:zinc finger BED domain-containing protein 5-like [Daktulosphaira vitifoliae]|uniref:zinc finger BED domain-containing protein 5-like n=1 Tax=Daktulosphaira vitifoliae TaxID=58002 RepID=UPI0021AA7199|nr:zinc finger BED domain-containing protein 5-like [Daktulosphaira vitifoliae]